MDVHEFWDSCAQNKIGNLKKWTFRKSGTPVRRTKRRKSQKLHFHKLWHYSAQRGAAFGHPPPSVVSFVLALDMAVNTKEAARIKM